MGTILIFKFSVHKLMEVMHIRLRIISFGNTRLVSDYYRRNRLLIIFSYNLWDSLYKYQVFGFIYMSKVHINSTIPVKKCCLSHIKSFLLFFFEITLRRIKILWNTDVNEISVTYKS